MKLSLKIQDQSHHGHHGHHGDHQAHPQIPLHLRAKIPITVFGLPFFSCFTASDLPSSSSSDLSLSLRTNFSTGPSLKLSYAPAATTSFATPPLTLTLKSGVSLSGSPNNSPLIISANFSFSPHNPNPIPTFSLQFKPRLGNFSVRKSTFSNPDPNPKPNAEVNSIGFVPIERPMVWKDLTMDSSNKDSILSGFAVVANTALPVTKRLALNFRWGVNFPSDFGKHMPFLSVNKIGIERVDQVKEWKDVKEKSSEGNLGDMEMLKGMCCWMRRELDVLRKENGEMKHLLDEMKLGLPVRSHRDDGNGVGKNSLPAVQKSSGFEQWKSKKNGGQEDWRKEAKKNVNPAGDVESELQRAIEAASS